MCRPLKGDIPESLCHLPTLNQLELSGNPTLAPGPVPLCLCNCTGNCTTAGASKQPNTTLQILRLGNTQRTGPIPTCLGEPGNGLEYMRNLSLSDNPGLTGPIPAELCTRHHLFGLYLQNNPNLSGGLPSCIWQLTDLRDLDLTGLTGLTGPLPPGLFALPWLEYLTISGASFDGGFPQGQNWLCETGDVATGRCPMVYPQTPTSILPSRNLTNGSTLPWLPMIKMLALVQCGISGPIPPWVMKLSTATAIVLSGNALTGTIPIVTGGINLTRFVAANNQLSGTLGPLQAATKLTELDLSENKLDGVVPSWLAEMSSRMTTIKFQNNLLSCELPPTLKIAAGGTLSVLKGNLYSCPVPASVSRVDPGAGTYKCGSSSMWFALTIVAGAAGLTGISVAMLRRGRAPHMGSNPRIPNSDAKIERNLDKHFIRTIGVRQLRHCF